MYVDESIWMCICPIMVALGPLVWYEGRPTGSRIHRTCSVICGACRVQQAPQGCVIEIRTGLLHSEDLGLPASNITDMEESLQGSRTFIGYAETTRSGKTCTAFKQVCKWTLLASG